MSKWFVFVNQTYYPYGKTIEAPDAKTAAAGALGDFNHAEPLADVPVMVFPADAVAYESWKDPAFAEADDA